VTAIVRRLGAAAVQAIEVPEQLVPERLEDIHGLSAVLGVSERECYRIALRVPHFRVGRMLRFDVAAVLSALAETPEVRP
jgi:hypothetical protein